MFDKLTEAVASIRGEVERAMKKHKTPMRSAHEAWGIIGEEWEEFKRAVHANDLNAARKEATQIGAMCARFLVDIPEAPAVQSEPVSKK